MLSLIYAFIIGICLSLLGTPIYIRYLVKKQYGQFIRQDGPVSHHVKRGTPTMGGVVIITSTVIAYFLANLLTQRPPSASGLLLLYLMVGLGLVGFADDFIKISRKRSLGLSPIVKIIGQGFVGISFAAVALTWRGEDDRTPASSALSVVRDLPVDLAFMGAGVGLILFIIWANFLITAWSNAVNLTDGLDGLATGASMVAFGSYGVVTMWQMNHSCKVLTDQVSACYEVRDPRDLAVVSLAILGACFGFLWWNASPAQIFMGDTGSLALGGAFAGLSIFTHTEFLAVFLGGLFVIITFSDVIQIGVFKMTRKRVFRMAPLHHHFELKGWKEITIVIRFWMIATLCAVLGLGLFYAEWIWMMR